MKKRIWLSIILIIVLLYTPKIVDFFFSITPISITSLNHIDASEFLQYLGSAFGGACSLAAILVAINQFVIQKRSIIIPRNIEWFLYEGGRGFVWLDDPEIYDITDDHYESVSVTTSKIVLDNVSENSAIHAKIQIHFDEKAYREFFSLMNEDPGELQSFFDQNIYDGPIKSKSQVSADLPYFYNSLIKGYCRMLLDNYSDRRFLEEMFFRSSKLGVMEIVTYDSGHASYTQKYDIYLRIWQRAGARFIASMNLNFIIQSSEHKEPLI